MPTRQPGMRQIVYPGGAYRTSREVAQLNDENSGEALPKHETLIVEHPSGNGWQELLDEICKYNAVTPEEATIWANRILVDPALARTNERFFEASVLGVRARIVKTV